MPRPEAPHRYTSPSHDGATAEEVIAHLDMRMMNEHGREASAHFTSSFAPISTAVNVLVDHRRSRGELG